MHPFVSDCLQIPSPLPPERLLQRRFVGYVQLLLSVVVLCVLSGSPAPAQLQWSSWQFGDRAGMKFDGDQNVTSASGSAMRALEGCASISDSITGELLFYTNGITVWNRAHQPMPNGTGLLGHESSTQSSLIVPVPGDSLRYYIFTTDASSYDSPPNDGLHYSIVDMSLDLGLGDVVTRNVRLLDRAGEKLCAVQSRDGDYYWVIGHGVDDARFYAWRLDKSGITDTVITSIGSVFDPGVFDADLGHLKVSPDGSRIASARWLQSNVELFDFDAETGRLSNLRSIWMGTDERRPYGVEFSPDNRKLYVSVEVRVPEDTSYIAQYDLRQPDASSIEASRFVVSSISDDMPGYYVHGALQLGIDRRIYGAASSRQSINRIDRPNADSVACRFTERAVRLASGYSTVGLPNIVISRSGIGLAGASGDDTICRGQQTTLYADGGSFVRWYPGTDLSCTDCRAPIAAPAATTTFYVDVFDEDSTLIQTDSVTVVVVPVANAGGDTTICSGQSVQLHASGGVAYTWSPAAGLSCADCADPVATPDTTTLYHVRVTGAGICRSVDSVLVTVTPAPTIDAGADVSICQGESVQLAAVGSGRITWQPAAGLSCSNCPNPVASPSTTTSYVVSVESEFGCIAYDSITVKVNAAVAVDAGADTTICRGSSVRLSATGAASYRWAPSDGLDCENCSQPLATPKRTTTYIVQGWLPSGCIGVDSVTVIVDEPETVQVEADGAYVVLPGNSVRIPVSVDGRIPASRVDITIRYRHGILRLDAIDRGSTQPTDWEIVEDRNVPGEWSGALVAPTGTTLPSGRLLDVVFTGFIADVRSSSVGVELSVPDGACVGIIQSDTATVAIDSVCGLNFRLIERITAKYSLDQNAPNPFSDRSRVRFSVGLDAHTTLRLYDARGNIVGRLVEGYLSAGEYEVEIDGRMFPAGVYTCRLEQGSVVREIRAVVGGR